MRDYLRRTCDDIWVIDCSPEGHQPTVNTRIFQGVQQPVCIVMASRSKSHDKETPATVRFRSLPLGHREQKFKALQKLQLQCEEWIAAPTGWRDPFLPQSLGAWSTFPALEDLFLYNGSGIQPGRTWIIAPDNETLMNRWRKLKAAPVEKMDEFFTPHVRDGELGDRFAAKRITDALRGFPVRLTSVAEDSEPCVTPIAYGYRSFDRQLIIPDKRVINQPNPSLWETRSDRQLFLTALSRSAPKSGPGATITALIPDYDHYRGSFGGRVFPLWSDEQATQPNLKPALLRYMQKALGMPVSPEDLFGYIALIAVNPAYIARFQFDLSTPGLRIPLTADSALFREAAELGHRILWLHTFGERMADPTAGRPYGPPRVPANPPSVPLAGRISSKPEDFPDSLNYDAEKHRLLVGHGYIDNVSPAVCAYEVSGKRVLAQWFSYRKLHRERPVIGDRRAPSALNDLQPDHWLPEYTTELLNVLNVLTLLVELEAAQADILDRICAGPLVSHEALTAANALSVPPKPEKLKKAKSKHPHLF